MKKVLYLSTFDPTVAATGTTTRGKLFLRFFCDHFDTHLIYMKEKDDDGRDLGLINSLSSLQSLDYSNFEYFIFNRKFYQAACHALRTQKFDLIFADFEKAGLYAYLLSKKFNVPYVYSSHNVEFLRYINVGSTNPIRYVLSPYMYLAEKLACHHALFTIAITDEDAKTFRNWLPPEKLLVSPCAFDESIYNPFYEELEASHPIILMVGNYRNAGNRDGAYVLSRTIVPEVVKQYPQAIFRCVGKHFPEDIHHPNIQSAGFVDNLLDEYRRAMIIIAPITMGGGIKIKVIEGLASGKHLIATPKAMEGIDATGMDNVNVLPIEHFAQGIIDGITTRPGKTAKNWPRVEREYGVNFQFTRLKEKLHAVLS